MVIRLGTCVIYLGDDDQTLGLWHSHPGRVTLWSDDQPEACVVFVNGPSLEMPLSLLQSTDDATYEALGNRCVNGLHPILPTLIPGLWVPGQEWP